jgi:hypothetical protein
MALPIPRLSAPRARQKPPNDDGLLPEEYTVLGVFGVFGNLPTTKALEYFGVEI